MRKLGIVVVFFAIVAIGYFAYDQYANKARLSLWSLVPENALVVYESDNFISDWEKLQEIDAWNTLSQLSGIQKLDNNLTLLDTLSGGNQMELLTAGNPLLVSLHNTAKNDFDFLYLLELNELEKHAIVAQLIDHFEDQGMRTQTRAYQGHNLTEITNSKLTFTYIFHQNYFIASFTSFLVEDVIRTLNDPYFRSFKNSHPDLFEMAKLQNDAGNIYLNSNQAGDLMGIFTSDLKINQKKINKEASSTFLDLSIEDQGVLMNGFTTVNDTLNSFLGTFKNNPAQSSRLAELTPTNTSVFFEMSFTDPIQWNRALKTYSQNAGSSMSEQRNSIKASFDIDVEKFFPWLSGNIGLITLESRNIEEPNKLLLIRIKDLDETRDYLNTLATRALDPGDSLYYELYDEIKITQLDVREFPQALLGDNFLGFEEPHFAINDQYLIIGTGSEIIRSWFDDLKNDNTWGKSVKTVQFLETSIQEANLSVYLNTNRAWNQVRNLLGSPWDHIFEDNRHIIRQIEYTSMQFALVDDKFYTSVTLRVPGAKQGTASGFDEVQSISFSSPLATKPFIVRNHTNRQFETVLQDSLTNLYLIGSEGQVIWSDSLGQHIQSDIHQIDFFKNRKLQYLFATAQHLYLIDRNGNAVEPYPLKIFEEREIDHLNVIDYDNSKRYRIIISDTSGDIFMYDQNGKNLEGWTPNELNGRLITPPSHHRARTRDRIAAIQEKGIVNLLSRPGKMSIGFPIDLKGSLQDPPFISSGSSFEKSTITAITNNGEIVQVNFNGQITGRQQLYKPTPETTFSTINDALNTGYLFSRKSDRQIAIIDMNGDILFEKDYLSSTNMGWQYYNFGGGKEIIIVLDGDQEFAYLYTRGGQLINYQPVESTHDLSLLYFTREDKFRLYRTFGNQFSAMEFDFE